MAMAATGAPEYAVCFPVRNCSMSVHQYILTDSCGIDLVGSYFKVSLGATPVQQKEISSVRDKSQQSNSRFPPLNSSENQTQITCSIGCQITNCGVTGCRIWSTQRNGLLIDCLGCWRSAASFSASGSFPQL